MPIISKNIRVRHPDLFSVGKNSIIDDFCYFSTEIQVGDFSHIANGCSVAGGKKQSFKMGNYCSLSAGVKIWCVSDDFVNDVITVIPEDIENMAGGKIKENLIKGSVEMGDFCAIGSNSVVMPGNKIPEGTTIGALSFVPAFFKFKPWSVYAGSPIRFIKKRNKKAVLRQVVKIEKTIKAVIRTS